MDAGNRSTTSAPEAFAWVGKLSFVGCRRRNGKSHQWEPTGCLAVLGSISVQTRKLRALGSPGALASAAGRGQENGTVSLGDRTLTLGIR